MNGLAAGVLLGTMVGGALGALTMACLAVSGRPACGVCADTGARIEIDPRGAAAPAWCSCPAGRACAQGPVG